MSWARWTEARVSLSVSLPQARLNELRLGTEVPTVSSIREMLPYVRRLRGQGITVEGGSNLMNFGRRYTTDERFDELLRLVDIS